VEKPTLFWKPYQSSSIEFAGVFISIVNQNRPRPVPSVGNGEEQDHAGIVLGSAPLLRSDPSPVAAPTRCSSSKSKSARVEMPIRSGLTLKSSPEASLPLLSSDLSETLALAICAVDPNGLYSTEHQFHFSCCYASAWHRFPPTNATASVPQPNNGNPSPRTVWVSRPLSSRVFRASQAATCAQASFSSLLNREPRGSPS
jgi:hypothetical protein